MHALHSESLGKVVSYSLSLVLVSDYCMTLEINPNLSRLVFVWLVPAANLA